MRNFVTCLLFFFSSIFVFSQGMKPKGSFQVHVGLPLAGANEPFEDLMQGLVSGSFHYQYTLENGLSFGTGLGYHYFTVNQFKASEDIAGGMHSPIGFGYLGYEKIHSRVFGTDFGIRAGYSQVLFKTDLLEAAGQSPHIIQAGYIEPKGSIILFGEDLAAFKFSLGYIFQGFGFRPQYIGLSSNSDYNTSRYNNIMRGMNISFAYIHYFRMH